MKSVLRAFAAVIAGMLVAFILVVAVEFFSSLVHPFPKNFDGNVPEHVRRYPAWVLAVVIPMWAACAFAATYTATKIASPIAGAVVTLLLGWALAFNLAMLPYPLWFKAGMGCAFPIACLLGIRAVRPRRRR